MGRIGRSWELFKQSWGVLRHDRELIWLPTIGAVLSLIVSAVVLVPIAITTEWGEITDGTGDPADQFGTGTYLALAALTLATAFISVFFRGALVSGAHERMSGGDPTVGSSLAGAIERIGKLFAWAVITTIVGTILRALEERAGQLGRFVINVVGMAWAVTTFLVIPVIIIEDQGAIDSTKRSVELFRRTWGENLAGQVGFGVFGLLIFLPLVVVAAIGIAVGSVLGFVLIAAAIVGGVIAAMVVSALSGIFQTALYHYATGEELAAEFDRHAFGSAFAPK